MHTEQPTESTPSFRTTDPSTVVGSLSHGDAFALLEELAEMATEAIGAVRDEVELVKSALALIAEVEPSTPPSTASLTELVCRTVERLRRAEETLAQSVLIDRDSVVRLLTASSSWAELEARCAKGYAPTLRAGHGDSPERAWLLHALRVEVLRAGHQVFPEPTVAELRAAGRDGGAA